jgi:hypothetical protein
MTLGLDAPKRLPKAGEGWRHYKGTLYTIVGFAQHTETGEAMVVYGPYRWPFVQQPTLWARPLNIFLGMADDGVRRFTFDREPDV